MAIPGTFCNLRIVRILDFGVYLDAEQLGEILLPMKYVPENCRPDESVDVFIYFDSNDRLIATTLKPAITLHHFAFLEAKAVNEIGAFMDWGLEKDLLIPYREQKAKIQEGRRYLTYLYADNKTGRLTGSARVERFLSHEPKDLNEGDEVEVLIWSKSDLGMKAIVNQQYEGLLYNNQIFTELAPGQTIKAFVAKLRDDGKIDLNLSKPGFEKIDELSEKILATLEMSHGFLGLNDNSSSEEIYLMFGSSKKSFKKAIGALFKQRLITIGQDGITLQKNRHGN